MGITQIRGNTTSRKSAKPIPGLDGGGGRPELQAAPQTPLFLERPERKHGINGAMAQQRGDHAWGNRCAPQKLLHLVGCREPKPAPAPAGNAKR